MPAKCFQLLIQRLCGHNIRCLSINLQTIDINGRAEVVQSVFGCAEESFPNLSFLHLSIS